MPARARSRTQPARNPHRIKAGWHPATVRAILQNSRYTGHEQWGKTSTTSVLLDPYDLAAGYRTLQRRKSFGLHVVSDALTHALVGEATWQAAADKLRTSRAAHTFERAPRKRTRPYRLAGRVRCALCHRKLESIWNNERPHHRCLAKTAYGETGSVPVCGGPSRPAVRATRWC